MLPRVASIGSAKGTIHDLSLVDAPAPRVIIIPKSSKSAVRFAE
jgi:hypothetical protein